jgi:hypothetical protein
MVLILWKKGAQPCGCAFCFWLLCSAFRVRENAELGMTFSRGTESPLFHGTAFHFSQKRREMGHPRFKSTSRPQTLIRNILLATLNRKEKSE